MLLQIVATAWGAGGDPVAAGAGMGGLACASSTHVAGAGE
jgi:hypothetical protein